MLEVQFDNGERVEAKLEVWLVALLRSLPPQQLAIVAEKVKGIKAAPRLIVPSGNGKF